MNKRCQIEEELKARVADFEKKIEGYGKEVESFRKKEVKFLNQMNFLYIITYLECVLSQLITF